MKEKSLRIRIDKNVSDSYKKLCDNKLQSMSIRLRKLIDMDLLFHQNGNDMIEKIKSLHESKN